MVAGKGLLGTCPQIIASSVPQKVRSTLATLVCQNRATTTLLAVGHDTYRKNRLNRRSTALADDLFLVILQQVANIALFFDHLSSVRRPMASQPELRNKMSLNPISDFVSGFAAFGNMGGPLQKIQPWLKLHRKT